MNLLKSFSFILLLYSSTIFFSGCYYDNEEELYENYYASQTCDTVAVSYDKTIRPIIESTCSITSCHVAGGTGNGIFGSYAGVKEKVDNGSFRERVVNLQNMPPNVPLNSCQIKLIEAWLDQGSLNN